MARPSSEPVDHADVLIVGAGLAGARCGESLRAGGYGGRIVVVGDEPDAPYERPALSKELLAGTRDAPSLALRSPGFWAERDVELRLGRAVEGLDLARRRARLGGAPLAWRHLVLATGARPVRIPGVPPADNVHHLRSLADARRLRGDLGGDGPLVIVGAGFVGAEVASSARALGHPVVVLEALPVPFRHVLGPAVGHRLAARYRDSGVDLRLGAPLEGVEVRGGRAVSVRLGDGDRVPCGALLVAVGARPAAALLDGALDLAPDGGVPTDAGGRTGHPDVLACGDVASPWRDDLGRHARLEHWSGAAAGGAAAARSILGGAPAPAAPPFFWSDQFGWRLQMTGHPPPGAEGEVEDRDGGFVARYRDAAGRVRAALAVNRPGDLSGLRAEIRGDADSVVGGAGP